MSKKNKYSDQYAEHVFQRRRLQPAHPESEADNYGLAQGSFVPLLVKGMQEQQTIIEAQKEEIDSLKSQLDKITAALAGAGIAVEK